MADPKRLQCYLYLSKIPTYDFVEFYQINVEGKTLDCTVSDLVKSEDCCEMNPVAISHKHGFTHLLLIPYSLDFLFNVTKSNSLP